MQICRTAGWLVVLAALMSAVPAWAASKPKLVVLVVIDQGRYDYPLERPTGYGPPPGGSKGYHTNGLNC